MGKKMTCQAIEAWTFSELVGAFLDLAIAYFLLCGSALAYFASKFLGLFGLCLPCPCDGLFGNPKNNNCWQGFLVDCPPEKISDVQFLAKNKFPFSLALSTGLNPQLMKECSVSEHVGLEGEASCGSVSGEVIGRKFSVEEGSFDVKGKLSRSQNLRYGIRRCQQASDDNDKSPSVSSFDLLLYEEQAVMDSPASFSKVGNEITECSSVPVHLEDGKGAFKENNSMPFELNEPLDENKAVEKDVSAVEEFNYDLIGELDFDSLDKYTIRSLEQALEEQHAARSALYLELEKERSAAATAADEAMAMILRLQEEKGSIEMEARQYQRMIEEKSAYDAEEMNILKEILLRREREKHFLEKEVETFRQMLFGIEQLDADLIDTASTQGLKASSSLSFSEDPVMTPERISESIDEKKKFEDANDSPKYEVTPIVLQNYKLTLGQELPIPEMIVDADPSKQGYISRHPCFDKHHQYPSRNSDEIIQDLKEKGMVLTDKNPVDQQGRGLTSRTIETCDETNIILPYGDGTVEKHGKDSQSLEFNRDLCIHDVHVIGDELDMCKEASGKRSEDLSKNITLDMPKSCDSPTISSLGIEADIKRSKSDISSGSPSMGIQPGKALVSDLRRNSMSAFDYERLKIDSEVGWLTERLRVVQEGREKLNFSVGHSNREKTQLQLLKDITSQLREIRQLTEPGKAAHEVSLPPLSSKVVLKKRRARSVSLEEQRST